MAASAAAKSAPWGARRATVRCGASPSVWSTRASPTSVNRNEASAQPTGQPTRSAASIATAARPRAKGSASPQGTEGSRNHGSTRTAPASRPTTAMTEMATSAVVRASRASRSTCGPSVDLEDDLADRLARLEDAVGLARLPEREHAVDHGSKPSRAHVLQDAEERRLGA